MMMNFLRQRFRAKAPTKVLEVEGRLAVENPSEEQVRTAIFSLQSDDISFASLTDEAGNYMQVAGSGPWCVIERRRLQPIEHERAFQETPDPDYKHDAKPLAGAGEIAMQQDEWFLLADAAELLVAFLHGDALPTRVKWRSMKEMLGLV